MDTVGIHDPQQQKKILYCEITQAKAVSDVSLMAFCKIIEFFVNQFAILIDCHDATINRPLL
jgi:hypothetical protein